MTKTASKFRAVRGVQRIKRVWGRLVPDTKGNTLFIVAASAVPLLAIVGGAVDMGRAYLTKTRLQQSCDAGVLAGRKAQVGTTYSDDAKAQADLYFKFNFSESPGGVSNVSFTTQQLDGDEITGEAKADISTAIMYFFGFKKFSLEANCGARMNLSDTDVMFVLDVTGSMLTINPAEPDDPPGTVQTTRIEALKSAVENFHDTLQKARKADVRLRYGFMPFAMNVNVGRDLKPEWMASEWTYPSRGFEEFRTFTYPGGTGDFYDPGRPDVIPPIPTPTLTPMNESCNAPANTYTEESTRTEDKTEEQADGSVWVYYHNTVIGNGNQYSVITDEAGRCQLQTFTYVNHTKILYRITKPVEAGTGQMLYWKYADFKRDVTVFKNAAGNAASISAAKLTLPINGNQTDLDIDWPGCIEERQTVRFTGTEVPAGAYDMDIDLVPDQTRAETLWGPLLPRMAFGRFATDHWSKETMTTGERIVPYQDWPNAAFWNGGGYAVCPAPAQKLKEMDAEAVTTYLGTLVPAGKTYPDIGILWGARYLSPTGIFSAANQDLGAGRPTGRNLILMTDGDIEPDYASYTAYSWEPFRRLRTDPDTYVTEEALKEVVRDRFMATCEAAKRKNITIWVVAFGTDLRQDLIDCSTGGRAYQAKNATELNKAFQNIAAQIGGLRLVK